ncbi:type II toxin-antitoxin system RelE/ParE family toxin [Arsukibacterium sp.]|uniref:type II toxin-antitoxin system RelE/ParE family toxin n=1 Tax=Arsukibacterium sp. TaxID=1977258 RepID=UPI0034204C66
MTNANQRYHLTTEAANDLLNVALYTVKQWGVEQSRRYTAELEYNFALLAANKLPATNTS